MRILKFTLFGFCQGKAVWQLCHVGDRVPCVNTTLPMTVHETLFGAGLIPDPLGPLQDEGQRWIAESDWTLTGTIVFPQSPAKLVVSGISAPSDIFVDGIVIGEAKSAFSTHNFPIPQDVSSGERQLSVRLRSSVFAAKQLQESGGIEIPECPLESWHGFCGPQYLRIPQYLFGWDWGIATGSLGLGALEIVRDEADCRRFPVSSAIISTDLRDGTWFLGVSTPMQISVMDAFEHPVLDLQECRDDEGCEYAIASAKSWWPRGYGDQPLYYASICDSCSKCILREFGFRDVEVRPKISQEAVGAWELVWNKDRPINIKGVNIVPSSAFRDATTGEVQKLFESLIDLEVNLIRQWGGGYYVSDFFYKRANMEGIIVWEELKMAGATYPVDSEDFMISLLDEVDSHLSRSHSNPSFAILSLDNEIGAMLGGNWFNASKPVIDKLTDRYNQFQRTLISNVIDRYRKTIKVIIPTSPWNGFDVHYYNSSVDCLDSRSFPSSDFFLVSEFGFQSWSLPFACGLDGPWRESRLLEQRQHRSGGNEEIWNLITRMFPHLPEEISVEEFAWMSQITQAVCLKSAGEAFMRQRDNVGIMVWQLNDVWPTVSWSLIDFDGIQKPAFFVMKELFSSKPDTNLYRDGTEIVVGPNQSGANKLFVVELFSGSTLEFPIDSDSMSRIEIPDICQAESSTCVAAVSPSNYILLSPLSDIKAPVGNYSVRMDSTTGIFVTVMVEHPTPFIYVYCAKEQEKIIGPNFIFLAPNVWRSFTFGFEKPCSQVRVRNLWSSFRPVSDDSSVQVRYD
jgi:beta-mannosidase